MTAFDVLDSFIEDCEISQSEEVHFEEANFFDGWSIPLSDDVFFSGDGLEWQNGIEWYIGDDDAGGVSTCGACESFDGYGEVEEFASDGVRIPGCFEFGAFGDGIFEADIECIGDHLGEFVNASERHIEGASDVTDGIFGFEGTVGTDLGDVAFAIFGFGVVDHHLSAVATEVDIDIRGFVAAGVEEAFEEEVIFEGADVSKSEKVGDDGSAGGSAGAAGDPVATGEFDEVPDDEEVAGVAFGFDDAEFVFEAFPVRVGEFVGVAFVHAFGAEVTEVLDIGFAVWWSEDGIEFAVPELNIDSIGDFLGACDGIFESLEALVHFVGWADV